MKQRDKIKIIYFFYDCMQLLTVISSIDDLNYPEKSDAYYIVNAPYIFSACWKVCYFNCNKKKKKEKSDFLFACKFKVCRL